jgi:hypothetical protein
MVEMVEELLEPCSLICSITHLLLRDPVFVPQSGNTYEREALVCTHPPCPAIVWRGL